MKYKAKRHNLNVKYYSVRLYLSGNWTVKEVCQRYNISSSSLMRWSKRYKESDYNRNSLKNKSCKPHSKHPLSHTDEEIKDIKNLLRRNPDITLTDLWIKLKLSYDYKRSQSTLYRFLRTNKIRYHKNQDDKKENIKVIKKNKFYPEKIYMKRLIIDVMYVPNSCKCDNLPEDKRYYQYTCIESSTRLRFLYWYDEKTVNNSIDFINKSIEFYGYTPIEVVSDNGIEFCFTTKSTIKTPHLFQEHLKNLKIKHILNTPTLPSKLCCFVESSHRFDSTRLYNKLKFNSLDDLQKQGNAHLKRMNNKPMLVLDLKSPIQKRTELIKAGKIIKSI